MKTWTRHCLPFWSWITSTNLTGTEQETAKITQIKTRKKSGKESLFSSWLNDARVVNLWLAVAAWSLLAVDQLLKSCEITYQISMSLYVYLDCSNWLTLWICQAREQEIDIWVSEHEIRIPVNALYCSKDLLSPSPKQNALYSSFQSHGALTMGLWGSWKKSSVMGELK